MKVSLHIYVILHKVNFFSVDKHILELIPFDNLHVHKKQ